MEWPAGVFAGHDASSHEYPFWVVYRSGDFGVKLDQAVLKNYRIEGIMIPLGRVLAILGPSD